jgi:small subunit ribosomal protein S21
MARLTILLAAMLAAMATAFVPSSTFSRSAIPASSTSLPVKIKVAVGEGEPIESALRRFKREVNKSGHLMDLRHKRYFENSQDRKKRKIVQARIRKRLERMQARRLRQQRS